MVCLFCGTLKSKYITFFHMIGKTFSLELYVSFSNICDQENTRGNICENYIPIV